MSGSTPNDWRQEKVSRTCAAALDTL